MDERATGAPIAVDEGMDRLELRVRERSLRDGRERVVVAEPAQVLQEASTRSGGGGTNAAEHGL